MIAPSVPTNFPLRFSLGVSIVTATTDSFERCDFVVNSVHNKNVIVTQEAPAGGGGFYYGFFFTGRMANLVDEFDQCFEVFQDSDVPQSIRDMAARNSQRLSRGILFDTATVLPEDQPSWLD
jgi:hypothetical protein